MNYTYDQLKGMSAEELFDLQLQFPPFDPNFVLLDRLLDEKSRNQALAHEKESICIATVILIIAFASFALSIL